MYKKLMYSKKFKWSNWPICPKDARNVSTSFDMNISKKLSYVRNNRLFSRSKDLGHTFGIYFAECQKTKP